MPEVSLSPVLGSHRITPDPDAVARQVLHVPTPMLRDMEKCGRRLSRDVSYAVRMGWSIGCAEVADPELDEIAKASRLMAGRKRPVAIALPMSTWLHLTMEAERRDRSKSWLVQRAWLAARRQILAALRG